MGNSNSQVQRSRKASSSSTRRQSTEIIAIAKKIDDKECIFIAMQGEIDQAITQHNKESMKSLAAEIAAHIMDLNQLKKVDMPSDERGRRQRVTYNFEISLAKLKSIMNSDTVVGKRLQSQSPETTQFYTEPDIVSDLIRFDTNDSSSYDQNRNTLPSLPEHEVTPSRSTVSRNNSLYSKQPQNIEEVFHSVESEFGVIKDQLERTIERIEEYYQMDKGLFYLQVRLKNIEVPQGSQLNHKKFQLIKDLADFRNLLDRKSAELEEQRDITQQINALELLVDSATAKEMDGLKSRGLILQQNIEKSTWDQNSTPKKIELLRRLARILESIAYSVSPAVSLRNSVEHLYGNLNSLQEELNDMRVQEEFDSIEAIDRVLEQQPEYLEENDIDDEAIYGNVEIIRQNTDNIVLPRLQRSNSKLSQRGTVYVNADIVDQNPENQNTGKSQELINKPPLPLPRNYEDKIISDLPGHWQRLKEILDTDSLSETDKLEVAEIRKHAELAKNLFERKIKRIVEKCEECVEL